MNTTSFPIGVFDSGMGGLTVLKALKETLPDESFIYLGDTARLPYGTKSSSTVLHYATQMARVLVEQQIKALVIACNTATTAALPHLQAMLPELIVMGVVEPGAREAAKVTQNEKLMVIATETTIASNAYQSAIHQALPDACIDAKACSVLVALAEEGMMDNAVAREAFKHYLQAFSDHDTLVLGCTHFPVFKPLLRSLLPTHVNIVDSALATALALKVQLQQASLLADGMSFVKPTRYFVTDSVARFSKVGALFMGEPLPHSQIELIDAHPPSAQ